MHGLYIHIPFCDKICPYCDFSTWKASVRQHPRWLKLVVKEMKLRMPVGMRVDTLYLGGGTPSLLDVNVFIQLIEELHEHLDLTGLQEFTLEANPASLTENKLEVYADKGVTKISVGVQSFNDKHLDTLGRLHNGKAALDTLEILQKKDFLVSLDLMFGIFKQSLPDWQNDLEIAVQTGVTHVSLYGLTYEENTLYHQHLQKGILKNVSDELYSEMYLKAVEILTKNNLMRYEVSNFSESGNESLHNGNYWNHSAYTGLGSGAHSFDGSKRYFNSKKFADYERYVINGCRVTEKNHEVLTPEILYEESIMLGLRTTAGIKPEDIKNKFGRRPSQSCLDGWVSKNYMEQGTRGHYYLKDEGWIYLDTITVDCLAQSNYI